MPYHFRVAAANALGYGAGLTSIPTAVAPAVQPPSQPIDVLLSSENGQSIDVSFMPPAIDGGASVEQYLVEFSSDPILSNVQEVRVNADPQQER